MGKAQMLASELNDVKAQLANKEGEMKILKEMLNSEKRMV